MSFKIINKQNLSEDIKRLDISAPDIARRIQPGQFVSVCPEEADERIPLTVVDHDSQKGIISLIIQERGYTTKKLTAMPIHTVIFSILGPLGKPAQIEKKETVFCVATGLGAAQILPICRAFKTIGTRVIGVIGAKSKRTILLEAQMRLACNKIFITTNDGSYERRGLATDLLKELIIQQGKKEESLSSSLVYAVGSVDMMQAVCSFTLEKNVPTRIQVNPMMADCLGMCGSCRIRVNGKIVLACLEGPEFDGHTVDFEDLNIRMEAFKETKQWLNPRLQFSQPGGVLETLRKFPVAILKK